MPEMTAHPSREQLSAYNLGQLPPDEAVAIDSHISECAPCCDTIISLSSDDTFVGLLKEARQLPTDQTVDHAVAPPSSLWQDIPVKLAEHPRYEILDLIGKGGMGDVYKARHRKMERTVALKVINRGLVRKAEAIDRFHREVKTAAQLSHPNIVTAYDADQAGDFHFMVMEYVDGVDLSQTVKDRGALPVAEACDYIRQAAIGLQHAHECGMVHRDIKPHNLMVTSDGTVKILDFGLASLAPDAVSDAETAEARGDLTAAGAIMGTPDFISPEQADDARQADIRSDIYSLGATLYFLLAGRPPFAEGSVTQKPDSHAQAEPEPLESLRDDVPPELVAIVTKMTAKDPDERYLTPREVADALESFLRSWQPDDAASWGQEPPRGGNGSGADGKKPGAGGAIPDWLPVAAKWLTYLSWIPIALLMWEVFFTAQTSVASDYRFWFYIGAAFCLSTVAGALSAAHRFQSEIRQFEQSDHRIFRMKADEILLIAGILIFSVCALVHYFQTNHGIVRVEVNDPSLEVSIIDQTITMKDKDGKTLTIRPSEQTLIVRKDDADLEFETKRFQIRRGDEIAFKVEMLQGEIVIRKDGERFNSKALPDDVKVQQILGRMGKAYAECDSYRDSGVTKTVIVENSVAPQISVEHSFTTVFQRPDRFRFEIKDEDDDKLLIFVNGQNVRTWWDVEPGIQKPESLELAMAQAVGFAGGDVGRIPALLMPQELEGWGGLDIIDPKQIEDGKLQDAECFRLEYNFRDEQIILWIDKQSYLVRRIDEQITSDGIRIERTTTYDSTIDGKITGKMLEFDPPPLRATGDNAAMVPPEITAILAHAGQSEVEFQKKLHNALSHAAGIPNTQWEKVATDPRASTEWIEGEPLSHVLLSINPAKTSEANPEVLEDFRYLTDGWPKPTELHEAMSASQPHGYVSLIQPEYIRSTKIDIDVEGKVVRGSVAFESPNLYAGKLNFAARYHAGRLTVVEFALPNYGITIAPDVQWVWHRKNAEHATRPKLATGLEQSVAAQIERIDEALNAYKVDTGSYPRNEEGLYVLIQRMGNEDRASTWAGPYLNDRLADPWGVPFLYEFPGTRSGNDTRPDVWSLGPDRINNTEDDIGNWEQKADGEGLAPRTILDQGYTIIDGGKAIGSRHLVVAREAQTLSIDEETTLTVMGALELDSTVDYSLSGVAPEFLRAKMKFKSAGNLDVTGSVELSAGEATVAWTSYSAQGRTLETPSKQTATVKVPPGPIVFGSTLQIVGPLLLQDEGEREIVWAEFDDNSKERLVEFKTGARIQRTERPPGGTGFTITFYEPKSSEPEMTLDFDGKGQCERIQSGGAIIQPRHKPLPKAKEERVLFRIETNKPSKEVASAIHQYYVDKYPQFAALNTWTVGKSKALEESLSKLGKLQDASPVSKMVNSFPGNPFVTFGERTELSKDQVTVTSVRLHSNEDGTCRIIVVENNLPKQDDLPFAKDKPITEEEIRRLVKHAAAAAEQAQPPVKSDASTKRKTSGWPRPLFMTTSLIGKLLTLTNSMYH